MQEQYKQICPVCGKEFYSYESENWAYKVRDPKHPARGKVWRVCSWGCMRKWERNNDKQRKEKDSK